MLLICIVLISVFPAVSFANQSRYYNFRTNYTLTGDPVSDIVAVAAAQLGAKQSELGYTEDWCDNFISDCAIIINQADAIPQGGNVTDFLKKLLDAGAKYVSSPQKGDIVIFRDKGICSHAGLMVDSANCINGNFGKIGYRQVKQYTYSSVKSHNGWTCTFLRPNYSTVYPLNVNITVDGEQQGSGFDKATFDLYLNGDKIVNDVSAYSYNHISDSSYTVKDIKISGCYVLKGDSSYSGTLTSDTAVTIPLETNHAWNSGKITEKATYFKSGEKTYTCTVCGEKNTEIIPKKTIDTDPVEERNGIAYAYPELTALEVIAEFGSKTVILKADGTKLKNSETVGSGMTLVKSDKTEETIIVKGDIDGNGKIDAADARFALRTAVNLEKPNDWQKNACDVDGERGVTSSDARLMLRAAVELETLISVDINN